MKTKLNFNSRTRSKVPLLLTALAAFAASGCHPTVPSDQVSIAGRLAFFDNFGCSSSAPNHSISWSGCNRFKEQFDPATNQFPNRNEQPTPETGLRAIPAAVHLLYLGQSSAGSIGATLCGEKTVQTDLNGWFRASMPRCNDGSAVQTVYAQVLLSYELRDSTTGSDRFGKVTAVWKDSDASQIFDLTGSSQIQQAPGFVFGGGTHYSIPSLFFQWTHTGVETPADSGGNGPTLNVGTQVFLADSDEDQWGYMRQVVSAYATMLKLHRQAISYYAAAGRESEYFDKMFVDVDTNGDHLINAADDSGWKHRYLIWLDDGWARGFHGGISLYRPDEMQFAADGNHDGTPDGSWGYARLLSEVQVLGHEFGHSLHSGFASRTLVHDYDWGSLMLEKNGTSPYDWGHYWAQDQEMGTSYVEGIASTIGQYLEDHCEGWTPSSRPSFASTHINSHMIFPDASCDDETEADGTYKKNACRIHHFREHLHEQGISDTDLEFYNRRDQLLQQFDSSRDNTLVNVRSNDEARWSEFGCDLLDTSNDVTHAAEITADTAYYPNLMAVAGGILSGFGADPSFGGALANYSGPVRAENVTLTLPKLLDTMNSFCWSCETLPSDRHSRDYINRRLKAVGGELSPQSFVNELLHSSSDLGYSREDYNNVLRSNFMEEAL